MPPRPDQSRQLVMPDAAQFLPGTGPESGAVTPASGAAPGLIPLATPEPGPGASGAARTIEPAPKGAAEGSGPMSSTKPTVDSKSNAKPTVGLERPTSTVDSSACCFRPAATDRLCRFAADRIRTRGSCKGNTPVFQGTTSNRPLSSASRQVCLHPSPPRSIEASRATHSLVPCHGKALRLMARGMRDTRRKKEQVA